MSDAAGGRPVPASRRQSVVRYYDAIRGEDFYLDVPMRLSFDGCCFLRMECLCDPTTVADALRYVEELQSGVGDPRTMGDMDVFLRERDVRRLRDHLSALLDTPRSPEREG